MEQADNSKVRPAASDNGTDSQGTLALDFAEQQQQMANRRNAPVMAASAAERPAPAASRTLVPRPPVRDAEAPVSAPAAVPRPPLANAVPGPISSTPAPTVANAPLPRTAPLPPRRPVRRPPDLIRDHIHSMSLGRTLQDAREALGLSAKEVSDQTRIKTSYLEFLEQDRLDQLPPPVYIRAYIRSLCALYGLDSAVLLEMLEQLHSGGADRVVSEEIIMQIEKDKQGNPEEEKKVKRLITVFTSIAAGVVLLLGVSIYFMMSGRHGGATAPSPVAVAVEPPTKPVVADATVPGAASGAMSTTFDLQKLDNIAIPPNVTVNPLPEPVMETKKTSTGRKRRR